MRDNQAVRERLKGRVGLEQLWLEGESISRLTPSGIALQSIKMAVQSIKASPFTAIMTSLTMIFALYVFAAFLLLAENVNRGLAGTQSEISMSIFLRDGITDDDRADLKKLLEGSNIIRTDNAVSKDQALENFRKSVGEDSPLLEGLDGSNPLPASHELTFRSVDDLEAQIEALAAAVRQNPGVEHVEYSRGVITMLVNALRTVKFAGTCAVALMLFLSGFIIAVAIRLALYAHRDEIEIMYLVGATRTFIRSPYMVEGLAQGLIGAVISILILLLTFTPIKGAVEGGTMATLTFGQLHFLSISSTLLVIALGIFVGVLGSYVAVRRITTVTIGE